jgi:hypothetical protein
LKKHTKIYFDYFGYDVTSFVPCEICEKKAVDINHIKPRGMGGSKKMDNIENLMAVCRKCHIEYADKKQYIDFLTQIHKDKCNLL